MCSKIIKNLLRWPFTVTSTLVFVQPLPSQCKKKLIKKIKTKISYRFVLVIFCFSRSPPGCDLIPGRLPGDLPDSLAMTETDPPRDVGKGLNCIN